MSGVSPARSCALAVVRRVFEHGAYADRAFTAEAAELDRRERALAMQIAYGTVQRRATLDHVAGALLTRPLERLEPAVLAALRVGLYQVLYLAGVPAHAAVDDSVELAKAASPGGATLVNAVLRRATREAGGLLGGLRDDDPAGAAVMHSVPLWLAELWWQELGAEQARSLLRTINGPAESALRVNTLVTSVTDALAELPEAARARPGAGWDGALSMPEALVLDGPFDAHGSALWRRGAIMPQSRGSMRVARTLAPAPGDRVLDLCAAPGAKTTHVAALIGDSGAVLAIERHAGRATALERTCARMRATCVRVEVADAAAPPSGGEPFDRVLVDPPCSGLGTLQSRPDLRWRARPEAIGELSALQRRILEAGAAALRPGGCLVYSVCTISRSEGDGVLEPFLSSHREFELEDRVQLLPDRDRTDGFYIASLRRHGRSLPSPP